MPISRCWDLETQVFSLRFFLRAFDWTPFFLALNKSVWKEEKIEEAKTRIALISITVFRLWFIDSSGFTIRCFTIALHSLNVLFNMFYLAFRLVLLLRLSHRQNSGVHILTDQLHWMSITTRCLKWIDHERKKYLTKLLIAPQMIPFEWTEQLV